MRYIYFIGFDVLVENYLIGKGHSVVNMPAPIYNNTVMEQLYEHIKAKVGPGEVVSITCISFLHAVPDSEADTTVETVEDK